MTSPRRDIAAVVPALNEAATIAAVVRGLRGHAIVIVVDDGGSDETGRLATEAGAHVVRHEINQGYDAALASGIERAKQLGATFAITLDADGQHDPALLLRFIDALDAGADLAIGVRDRHQRFAESLFARVGRWLWKIDDPLCGMKGYRLPAFEDAGRFDRYKSIGTSFAIVASRSGLRIAQLPVPTRPRIGAPRFGSGLRANLIILKALALGFVMARPDRR